MDSGLVYTFHDLILNDQVNAINIRVVSTPRLSNSKDTQDYTLLIATGISEVLWKTQIRLIDIKMERGTLFATQGPNRSHVLLLVCLNSLVGG